MKKNAAKNNLPKVTAPARKIAILGTATQSSLDAPFEDPSWKIWNMSANFVLGKRFDLWFELHPPEILAAAKSDPKYFDFLKNAGQALITGHLSERWPDAQPFPILEIVERYGDYFTCSAALMLAFALYQHESDVANGGKGISEIGLWGIHMQVDGEYGFQKPCVEYWVGFLRGRGIKVTSAPQSPVCRTNGIYGFDNLKLSREFTERLTELRVHKPNQEKRLAEQRAALAQTERAMIEEAAVERVLNQIAHLWNL